MQPLCEFLICHKPDHLSQLVVYRQPCMARFRKPETYEGLLVHWIRLHLLQAKTGKLFFRGDPRSTSTGGGRVQCKS